MLRTYCVLKSTDNTYSGVFDDICSYSGVFLNADTCDRNMFQCKLRKECGDFDFFQSTVTDQLSNYMF